MLSILRQHLTLLIVWGLVVGIIAGSLSFLFPLQYSAVSQVLIISKDRSGVDPYTQAKSAERIGENLAEVVKTTDFYGKVFRSSTIPFDKNTWNNLTDRDRRKKWQRDVKPEVVYGTSLLRLTAFATSPSEAKNLCNAVAQTLVDKGNDYVGGDVSLSQVDDPLVSRFPTRPNLVINVITGFVIGALLSSLWILKYRRHTHFGKL